MGVSSLVVPARRGVARKKEPPDAFWTKQTHLFKGKPVWNGPTKEYADSDGLYGRVNTQFAEFDGSGRSN